MALVSLKLTPEEKAAEAAKWQAGPESGEDYPCGVELRLDDAAIKKLGLGPLMAGSMVTIQARASVEEVGEEMKDGKAERSLELQITDMSVEPASDRAPAETLLYDKGNS